MHVAVDPKTQEFIAIGVETGFSSLPEEMVRNIVKYLPEPDLFAFSKADRFCFQIALHEYIDRAEHESSLMLDLSQKTPTNISSKMQLYRECLVGLHERSAIEGASLLPTTELEILQLQQKLEEYKASFIAYLHLPSTSTFTQEAEKTWKDIKATQSRHIAAALKRIVEACPNLEQKSAIMGMMILKAASHGNLEILDYLVRGSVVHSYYMSQAVKVAVEFKHTAIVELLLPRLEENDEFDILGISDFDRGFAVITAARRGNAEIVRLLLQNGPIDIYARGDAVRLAARCDDPVLIKEILTSGEILKEDRDAAIDIARRNNHHEIVKLLSPQSWCAIM